MHGMRSGAQHALTGGVQLRLLMADHRSHEGIRALVLPLGMIAHDVT